ncbi:hypothetical protein FRB96_003436 [Tulasnella sp. 330]|nr:hypothetical protein FRB96_003436 [Tulasnella sp. 330]KAG8882764.1 hypothetical protein FRB97_007803 [Tulasnella sp. 331]
MSTKHDLKGIMVSTVLVIAAVSLAAASLGYYMGKRNTRTLQLPPEFSQAGGKSASAPAPEEGSDSEEEEENEEEGADIDLNAVSAGLFEACKLVLVVRSDLGMTKGKIAAQCGHATLACYKALKKTNPKLLKHWERVGQAKVALRCDSEEELLTLQAMAQSVNLCARVIRDAGRTQIASGSQTVLGIGPGKCQLQAPARFKCLTAYIF